MRQKPEHRIVPSPVAPLAGLALIVLGWLSPAAVVGEDAVWVRVHHAFDHPAIQQSGADQTLADYGAFQWGRLPADQAALLERSGGRLTRLENPFELRLGDKRIDLLDMTANGRSFEPYRGAPEGDLHLVQFRGPVRSEWLRRLRATGVQIIQPAHPFSYYVWADANQISAAAAQSAVRASATVRPDWRMQPSLRSLDARPRPSMALITRHARRATLERMQEKGASIHSITRESAHFDVVHFDLPGHRYEALGRIPGIFTVQRIPPDAGPRGEMSNQSVVGGFDSDNMVPGYADWLTATGYDGYGITVGVVDSGVAESHPDLIDNIEPCLGSGGSCTGTASNHGTHVAGAIAGSGASGVTDAQGFRRGQGSAPAAGIINQDYQPFLDSSGDGGMVADGMLHIMADAAVSGALLTNNSWGPSGTPQGYDIPTRHIDLITRDALPDQPGHSPMLAVWSIMNGYGDSAGECSPSSLGTPDEAKNLLAVGSTGLQSPSGHQLPIDQVYSLSSNSAHGPACDGRRVPDLVAPGCHTDSTHTGNSHGLACGTSMASPVVSGAIAVWTERHIDQTGSPPSPALVKAVFIAAARNLAGGTNADGHPLGHRPDRFQGFGRLDLDAVMNPDGGHVYLMDQEVVFDDTGQDWSATVQAANPDMPMKIVLTWTDAPGPPNGGTTQAWVNILDLEVDAADGNTYLGNVTGPEGWSEPGGSPDDRNNTEGIWLRPDQHQGTIHLNVLAATLAGDALNPYDPGHPSQDFAIACYNCIEGDPVFNLVLEPDSVQACLADMNEPLSIEVQAGTVGPYTGTIDLVADGVPADIVSTLDPASISVPGGATWTLAADEHTAPTTTLVTLDATDADGLSRTRALSLRLDDTLTETPGQQTPANNSSEQPLAPEFTWSPAGGAETYRLQVARDPDFSEVIIDEQVRSNSFVPEQRLDSLTEHHWRVRASNLCGAGDWSPTWRFITRPLPKITLSTSALKFVMRPTRETRQVLEIGNTGTGDLGFDIATKRPEQAVTNARALHGLNDPQSWQLVNDPNTVNGSVEFNENEALEILLIGGDDDIGGNTDLQTNIPMSGTLRFDWGYQSEDTGHFDSAGYLVNQTVTPLADNDSQVPYFEGQASVMLSSDDVFALRVNTHDGRFGAGKLGVTRLRFEPEACNSSASAPDWLSVAPASGLIPGGESMSIEVTVNSDGLAEGIYHGALCVQSNAENAELLAVHVELEVAIPPIFQDRFEAGD